MVVTLCTSGAAVFKAGTNAPTDITEAQYISIINQAESSIASETKYDWVANYAALSVNVKYILEEVCSNIAGMYIIQRDMSGYSSRQEAQTMLDVLYARINAGLRDLKEKFVQTFMTGV